jgi:hypothetical protein
LDNWAQSLQRLLLEISKDPRSNERFLSIAAEKLNISGEMREVEAARKIVSMFHGIRLDMDQLNLPDDERAQCEKILRKFSGIEDLSQIDQNMDNAKRNYLKADSILSLLDIDYKCRGLKAKTPLNRDVITVVDDLKEVVKSMSGLGLPADLMFAIDTRITQISNIVGHFEYYSKEELEDKVSELLGAIVVAQAKTPEKVSGKLNELGQKLLALVGILSVLEAGSGHLVGTMDNVDVLIGRMSEATVSEDERSGEQESD